MKGKTDRSCAFICALALKIPGRETLIAEGSTPIALSTAVLSEKEFAVEVKNKTGKTLKGIRVSIDTPSLLSGESAKTIASIDPEASARATFTLKRPISTAEQKIKVNASIPGTKETESLNADLRALIVKRTAKPIRIDGDLSDWPAAAPVVKLDKRNVDPKCKTARWMTTISIPRSPSGNPTSIRSRTAGISPAPGNRTASRSATTRSGMRSPSQPLSKTTISNTVSSSVRASL